MARLMEITILLALCAITLMAKKATAECASGCKCIRTAMTCSNKGLTALPQFTWPNVRMLDLSFNNITSLDGLGLHFPALTVLFVRNNAISTLVLDSLAGPNAPSRLMAVDLSRNAISKVVAPSLTASDSKLALLYLGSNRLQYLHPYIFLGVTRLEGLSLQDNPLEMAAGLPLLVHPRLSALDLTRINAAALTMETFAEMPALTEISLEGSGVRNITGAFLHLRSLDSIYLQTNEITELTVGSFAEGTTLSDLYLDNNPLLSIDVAALPMAQGGKLRIEQTPLACSCAYEDVARWAEKHEIKLMASCYGAYPCPFANFE